MKYRWVLASASPRRKELLKKVIPEFDIIVSDCEENYTSVRPEEIVKELACLKGSAVAEEVSEGTVVVAADTIVSVDGSILGKPRDYEDSVSMLRRLSGRKHQVYTGVCVILKEKGRLEKAVFSEVTEISVDALSEQEIHDYITAEEPYDKAGSYGIQDGFAKHVSGISGDYNNVVGFPVHSFYSLIKEKGYLE